MTFDPYVAERVHLLHEMAERGGFATDEGRGRWNAFFALPDGYEKPDVDVREHLVEREEGPAVPVRIYRDHGTTGGPGFLWAHGGGFTGGSLDMFEADGVSRELARRTGGTVVSVDYRLATAETFFPAPVDDVLAAWTWFRASRDELGIDGMLALGGASAGAALTAGATVALRDAGDPLPDLLVLVYPSVHPVLPPFSHELAAKLADIPPVFAWWPDGPDDLSNRSLSALLGGPEWTATSHAMAALAHPRGLPRTLILNAEYDSLRASGEAFAAQLATAGVEVELRCAPGVLHGHLNLPPASPAVEDSLRLLAARLTGF